MNRRALLLGLSLAMAGLAIPRAGVALAAEKEEKVTLEISGMT